MSKETLRNAADEPERFELDAEPPPRSLPMRADLFSLFGPGLAVLVELEEETASRDYGAWLHVGESGRVTVCSGKAEVGQNIRTSLAQAAADELCVPVENVRVVLGDTDLTPFDMGTFGSRTTPYTAPQVRRAAAGARELLIRLAAERWGLPCSELTVQSGKVMHEKTGQGVSYAQLVAGGKITRVVGHATPLRPADRWKIAGASAPKTGGREFVTGKHHFASDLSVGGMLYGKVLRPPKIGALLKSVDLCQARAMAGVTVVHEDGFVGVAAPTVSAAAQALAKVKAEWEVPKGPSGQDLVSLLRPVPTKFKARGSRGSAHRLQATFTVPYIAHVPLEPRAALATWQAGKLTVWTGTQRPFGVREELSIAFNISEDRVRVIVPDTGSGYGGKHTGEAAIEAARLARAAGKPVKVVWTREEEFSYAYLRPAGVIDISAAIRADGPIVEWDFHNYNSGGSAIQSPYDIPNQRCEFHEVASPLRQGSYRALAATANTFARECHMDDLAHEVGMDPLTFRLSNLKDKRLRDVLLTAADRFGWRDRQKTAGHGFGLACGTEKGSYVANCVEIGVEPDGAIKILRIVSAYECGAIVNPLHLENQVEGATVMGIGGALFEAIQFEDGRILNPRLSEYSVPRFGDVPEIEIALLDRKDLPSVGAGETQIIAIAPAIGNAIFDASGIRLRDLPFAPNGVIRKS
jgi:isoquinoline 1-oxidoreductase